MGKRLIRLAAALAMFVAAGPAIAAEVDQIAQSRLIGISAKKLRACLGPPAERRAVGYESIWTFSVGTLMGDGPVFLFPLDLHGIGAGGGCDVRFVLDRYGVSQIYYTLPGGAPLPLGKLCSFPAEACAALR
jgi:hypothetical protein